MPTHLAKQFSSESCCNERVPLTRIKSHHSMHSVYTHHFKITFNSSHCVSQRKHTRHLRSALSPHGSSVIDCVEEHMGAERRHLLRHPSQSRQHQHLFILVYPGLSLNAQTLPLEKSDRK